MGIDLQRLNVKFYLADDAILSPEDAFRIFSRWIPETADEILIDVADYAHVPHGPKTVLVGYDANYSLDDSDGRPGLRYCRKRPVTGENSERLRAALHAALRACHRLETATDDTARPRFLANEALLFVNDRLRAADDQATLAALEDDLKALSSRLFPGDTTHVDRVDEGEGRFAVRLRAEGTHTVEELLASLG